MSPQGQNNSGGRGQGSGRRRTSKHKGGRGGNTQSKFWANKPMVFSRTCTFALETVDLHSFLNWKRHFRRTPRQENKQRSP